MHSLKRWAFNATNDRQNMKCEKGLRNVWNHRWNLTRNYYSKSEPEEG